MSAFTTDQLRSGTLVGMTDELGNPWWGTGHFSGSVPMEDARRLLTVNVTEHAIRTVNPTEAEVLRSIEAATDMAEVKKLAKQLRKLQTDGADTAKYKAIVDSDTGYVFQVATNRWTHHEYSEVLLENVATLLDASGGDLTIGSVIALDHRQKAVVQVRPNEGVTVGGDMILPWLAAFSSLDSTWATGYKPVRTRIVCDNTAAMARGERTAEHRIRHTAGSALKLSKARETVGLFFAGMDDVAKELEELMAAAIKPKSFDRILSNLWPLEAPAGEPKFTQHAVTRRENIRHTVRYLYETDPRVKPWNGTAWGVLQAVNTWGHHHQTIKGDDRVGRQARQLVDGKTDELDALTIAAINEALQAVGQTPVLAG